MGSKRAEALSSIAILTTALVRNGSSVAYVYRRPELNVPVGMGMMGVERLDTVGMCSNWLLNRLCEFSSRPKLFVNGIIQFVHVCIIFH